VLQPDLTLNPNAVVDTQAIGDSDFCVIIDDFLKNPESVIDYAVANATQFDMPPMSYPGKVLDLPPIVTDGLRLSIKKQMARRFAFMRGGIITSNMLSMTTLKPEQLSNLQRVCHTDPRTRLDRANFAGLLYLFKDESLGGTGFYRWRDRKLMEEATALELRDPDKALAFLKEHCPTYNQPPCYITESNELAELVDVVPARFNRWIFYSGDIPHSAYITAPEKLTDDFTTGRLTLNCFASVIPK